MAWGDKHHFIIYCFGESRCVGRFSRYEDALEHKARHMKSYQSWKIYCEDMVLLGYVRKDVLESCTGDDRGSTLAVVPTAPDDGLWTPIYIQSSEGDK